ncbi:hypothetical protein V494_06634 [Pseudogymnoascus sp. VKM F-4513 (FW-928)]|nr:hypothetical protein V494_06634 [Pseudogymnoascus sp. VKM F-4513 (FW-928)]
MNDAPATRDPSSPARHLNRSKSVFSLAQDFFKLALNTSSDGPIPGSQASYAKPGPWNLFGSLRGTWNSAGLGANPQRSGGHSASQSPNQPDAYYEDAPSSLLRHRKSLHNLFGTVGKRNSMKARADRTVQPNLLRKRSGTGDNLQASNNPSMQSIEDADRAYPPKTYPAGSHATVGRRNAPHKDETVREVSRPDSGVCVNTIYAPRHDYQGTAPGSRAPGNKVKEEAATQPHTTPIKLFCSSEIPSPDRDSSSYAIPLHPTVSDCRPVTKPLVSENKSCVIGSYAGAVSQSLCRTKENVDSGGTDYNKLLASAHMPTKIDIDSFFPQRALSLEHRYKDLSIRLRPQQPSNTEHDPQRALESTDQNAARMSKNFNIFERRCSQSRFSGHSNATSALRSVPRGSWVNTDLTGHECGMFTQDDQAGEEKSCLDEKLALCASQKQAETTSSRENVIRNERLNISPEISLCETLSASPLLVPKKKKPLPSSKKRRAMRSTARNSSMGPFHINFPKTEFGEAHNEIYPSKSDAIGSLFQSVVEYSNYILFDRGSSTFYPQPKGYVFGRLEEQSKDHELECIWLPMQFGRFKDTNLGQELSLKRHTDSRRGGNHPLADIGECEGDAPAPSTAQSEESNSIASTPSNNSLLDFYFGTPENSHQGDEISKLKQPEKTPATAVPISLTAPLREPANPPKLGHFWGELDDGIITEPLDKNYSVGKTKTWADLGVEFIDKYAPDKNADGQKRAVDAARNFLRAHGKLNSDYDPIIKPQRKTWSRDRDGSEDISFLHVEDLARYETLRDEYRRHMALNFEVSSSNSPPNALDEVSYVIRTREVSRGSSRDSGYAETDATLAELYLGSREKPTTEALPVSSHGSSSKPAEDIAALKAINKVTFSPCHSPVLEPTRDMDGGAPSRTVKTVSFGKFEFEDPFDPQVGNENTAGNIDTEGLKTPRRAPLQGARANFTRQGRKVQNQPASQSEAVYYGPAGEPLQKRKPDEEDEKENEERNWRDIMLYG